MKFIFLFFFKIDFTFIEILIWFNIRYPKRKIKFACSFSLTHFLLVFHPHTFLSSPLPHFFINPRISLFLFDSVSFDKKIIIKKKNLLCSFNKFYEMLIISICWDFISKFKYVVRKFLRIQISWVPRIIFEYYHSFFFFFFLFILCIVSNWRSSYP